MKYFQLTVIFILFFSFQSLSNNYKKCGTEDPRYSDCYGSVDYKNSKSIKKHTGFFKNGKPHGQGVMILNDGREIYSNFKNGTINGKTQIFSKGSTFEIQFLDGKAVSKGKFAFKGRPKKVYMDKMSAVIVTVFQVKVDNLKNVLIFVLMRTLVD